MPSSNSWLARHKEGAWYSLVAIVLVAVVCGGITAGVNFAGRDAFAEAEAYMLQHALTCPEHYDVSWCLTHANEYSKINAMYGIFNYKYVDWETSEEAYTTEQYEEFAAAFEAAKQA